MSEERESIQAILRDQALALVKSLRPDITDARAEEIATRHVNQIFNVSGGRPWYHPKSACFQAAALEERNEAIRVAHSKDIPRATILRTFRISRARFYQILKAG